MSGYNIPAMNLNIPKTSTDEFAAMRQQFAKQALSWAMNPRNSQLNQQLSLMRTLKSLGLMNGFTDPVTGEFIRTPGQKLSKDERKEYLEQEHQRAARNAILNNEALFERLRENQNLSAAKRLQNLRDIKKTDIAPIAKQYGVDAGSVYKGLFGELDQEYAQAKKEVEESSGLGSLWNALRLTLGEAWEGTKGFLGDYSAQEKIERGQQWQKERQAIIESDPYLADQAKREAEGEGYFKRMDGIKGGLINISSTALGFLPYVGATAVGGLAAGPYGAVAAPAALGAAQGVFGLTQRAVADPNLTQEQREAAVGFGPSLAAGTVSGALAAVPGNIGRAVPKVFGRGAAQRMLQTQMPGASADAIKRSLPEAITARAANYATQHPVRNALLQGGLTVGGLEGMMVGGQLGSNVIYNMATGSDTPLTEGLGEAAAQGLVGALPFGIMAYRQRPIMPESYRLGKEGPIRKLTVDEYAERVRNQYSTDPTNQAAMTGILASARQDLGNASFDGLMGRVLAHPSMKNLSPETVGQWERLFNTGVKETVAGPRTARPAMQDDVIPGLPEREQKVAQGDTKKPKVKTESQLLVDAVNKTIGAERKKFSSIEAEGKALGATPETILKDQAEVLARAGGVLDDILSKFGAVDIPTMHITLDKLATHLATLPEVTQKIPQIAAMKEAINLYKSRLPEQQVTPVVDATGRKIADSFNVRPAEEGGPSARPEQPAGSMGGDGQTTAARAATTDTTIPGGVATDTARTAETTANGTAVQDTGVGTAAQGRGVGGAEAQNIGARQGADVPGETAGTATTERGADTRPSAGEIPGDETTSAGAGKSSDTGVREQDSTQSTEGVSRGVNDTELTIRTLHEVEARSPDTEFLRLNQFIDTKNDMMFAGAVGGYQGSKTAAAKRQYVADLMDGLYRTALNPDEVLPNHQRWKVSKYLVANKGVNPMSEGMAEGIHKLWNNAEGISEREYLLNTLRDPDEQRRRILENVKCQLIIARRTAM